MQKMNEIRYHIRAVEQTRKITNAMHLISSSRMKKVMPQVEYNRRYLSHVQSAMQHIVLSTDDFNHPYLHGRETSRDVFIVVSGDKGMVGSYNADLLKFALRRIKESPGCHLVTLGLAADHFFRRAGIVPDIQIMRVSQDPSLHNARHIMQDMFRLYDDNIIDRVFIIYTRFIHSAKWYPDVRRLLPLDTGRALAPDEQKEEMIYHPSAEEMFDLLIPQYTVGIIYGALMNAYVSENCARMNAMQSATRNADELLKKLKTRYNIARQSAITQEITEITQTAMAMGE